MMNLSLNDAAVVLGKSQRQIRYLIKTGRLNAVKESGRWRIDSESLPLSDSQRAAFGARLETAREAMTTALEPTAKALDAKGSKRRYSVTNLTTFQAGEQLYRALRAQLGPDDPSCRLVYEAMTLVTRGCHCFHAQDKIERFASARDSLASAVAELLLHSEEDQGARRKLAERLEQELVPKLAGLIASHEKKNRRSRFDQFGSSRSQAGGGR